MIKISQYLSCIYMYILLINALIIYIGMQPTNLDTPSEHDGGINLNLHCSTQGIHFLFEI